jgi:hypothetical protein
MVSLRGSCRSARAAVDAVRAHRAEHDRCVQRQSPQEQHSEQSEPGHLCVESERNLTLAAVPRLVMAEVLLEERALADATVWREAEFVQRIVDKARKTTYCEHTDERPRGGGAPAADALHGHLEEGVCRQHSG